MLHAQRVAAHAVASCVPSAMHARVHCKTQAADTRICVRCDGVAAGTAARRHRITNTFASGAFRTEQCGVETLPNA
jgi:hypothetical protein